MKPSRSWLGGWFKKEAGGAMPAGPGPIKANLGEQTSFVYDPVAKRWVNKKVSMAFRDLHSYQTRTHLFCYADWRCWFLSSCNCSPSSSCDCLPNTSCTSSYAPSLPVLYSLSHSTRSRHATPQSSQNFSRSWRSQSCRTISLRFCWSFLDTSSS